MGIGSQDTHALSKTALTEWAFYSCSVDGTCTSAGGCRLLTQSFPYRHACNCRPHLAREERTPALVTTEQWEDVIGALKLSSGLCFPGAASRRQWQPQTLEKEIPIRVLQPRSSSPAGSCSVFLLCGWFAARTKCRALR